MRIPEGKVPPRNQKVSLGVEMYQPLRVAHLQNCSRRRARGGIANLRARGQSAASEVRLDVKLLGVTAWAHSFGLRRAHAPAEAINLEKMKAVGRSLVRHPSVESVHSAVMVVACRGGVALSNVTTKCG